MFAVFDEKNNIHWVWITDMSSANIEQRTIDYGWRQNQEAKLKIVGRDTYAHPWIQVHTSSVGRVLILRTLPNR